MSQFGVILALLFSLIIALFAIANNQPIVVNYLYGRAEVSAVIVILGAAILGALVIFLLSLFRQVRTGFQLRGLRQEVNNLQEKIQEIEAERDSLLVQVGQLQEAHLAPLQKEKRAGEEAEEGPGERLAPEEFFAGEGEAPGESSREPGSEGTPSEEELPEEPSFQEEQFAREEPEQEEVEKYPGEEPEKKEDHN